MTAPVDLDAIERDAGVSECDAETLRAIIARCRAAESERDFLAGKVSEHEKARTCIDCGGLICSPMRCAHDLAKAYANELNAAESEVARLREQMAILLPAVEHWDATIALYRDDYKATSGDMDHADNALREALAKVRAP